MDYQKLIRSLLDEAKEGIQYQRMTMPFKVLAIVAMIPVLLIELCLIASYYVLYFFYNAILSPIDYLESWQRERTREVKHVTEAVVYLVSTPTIFFGRVLLSFVSLIFYCLWFCLMTCTYILTLGGIRWQPYINTAKYDKIYTWNLKPEGVPMNIFTGVAVFFSVASLLISIINLIDRTFDEDVEAFFWGVYFFIVGIINPIMFRKQAFEEYEDDSDL